MERMATKHNLTHAPVFSNVRATGEKDRLKRKDSDIQAPKFILYPWSHYYKMWWGVTGAAAVVTVFNAPFGVAFSPAGDYSNASSIIEYFLVAIFVIDIFVRFNTAFYNMDDQVVSDRKAIAYHYVRNGTFLYDFLGVFPFYIISLAIAGEVGSDSKTALVLGLFRLLILVRIYRIKQLFDVLAYSSKVSLLSLTLVRNLGFSIAWSHFAACTFYFISRLYNNPEDRWIGDTAGLSTMQIYVTSMYWSVVTFATVGYGDWSAVNSAEQVWCIVYMLINIVIQAWIIGSITLLVVKNDAKTGLYRDALQKLGQYSANHGFDHIFYKRLKTALKLSFESVDIADEEVLMHFPSSVRRRILRRLYMPSLLQTSLMKNVRQQFVDSFLAACSVEVFSPGEEIMQRGAVSSDLYLLVNGVVEVLSINNSTVESRDDYENRSYGGTSIGDSEFYQNGLRVSSHCYPGDFLNEISFFTESPQMHSLKASNVARVLTISRSAYKGLCDDHPCSSGIVLQNLLTKVQEMVVASGGELVQLTKPLSAARAGSMFQRPASSKIIDDNDDDIEDDAYDDDGDKAMTKISVKNAVASLQELVRMHIEKLKDDLSTRFLFAASRGDIMTVSLMCDQGFDPDSTDYDNRTALMVGSMKGQTEVVQKLLEEYKANPNLVDVNGGSALYEAAKNGHDDTMEVLIRNGATLCMSESLAASTLCQLVFDGDALTLRRLLRAKVPVNAADYDRRSAAHIAAAEGNLVAFKLLVEFGCDLTVKDRWNNSIEDEATKAADGAKFLEYLRDISVRSPLPKI
jgi:ankyrin repeat protein/CRP-like cAMP-binding protein